MAIKYSELPVYEQKQRILDMLEHNQVIVVQSPTGSGKTTQIPIILHEAGFSQSGMIAVTQPRRIAALSVSEFIAKQLKTTFPGMVGYKMRFEDKTDHTTKIKIMTDGILLQEMKLDPYLSKYSVIMVDEAHERSLNIDFVLGLLKRLLQERPDFKVIISSATMNTELFSAYFDDCPIVTIDTITYPVATIYDPPLIAAGSTSSSNTDALSLKVVETVERVISNAEKGDVLVFLPGEKAIKDCMNALYRSSIGKKLFIIPLYGRLAKEEQERVFLNAPFGKKKVVISTNIAETSITIAGISVVIDCGLAKLNYYSPTTFTSSLVETAVSKASCNQRKGRAGRTQAGTCYRLYERKNFENRQMYTTEEIYRTDLSEVVLRMAELGITDFEQFDFISPPNEQGIRGAIDTLTMLHALNDDRSLSSIGQKMVYFPLLPRQSRIIVEAMLSYPSVIEEVLIAAAFLSASSPFVLPPGEETDARKAHHRFRDNYGDFVTYLKLFHSYCSEKEGKPREQFCKRSYLDDRVMAEIKNIKEQLEQIVSDIGVPIISGMNSATQNNRWIEDYLTCVATGHIQFVCMREKREQYRTLTAERIQIHPGSVMFRTDPQFIVAGEIVRTSRMFAMSVSPLTVQLLNRINPLLIKSFRPNLSKAEKAKLDRLATYTRDSIKLEKPSKSEKAEQDSIRIGDASFALKKIKGKKYAILPWKEFSAQIGKIKDIAPSYKAQLGALKAKIVLNIDGVLFELLSGEKLESVFKVVRTIPLVYEKQYNKANFHITQHASELVNALHTILHVTVAKQKNKELGFICLFTDANGSYWFKVSRGFSTALNESLSSLETLIDEQEVEFTNEQKNKINDVYRTLSSLYE